MGTRPDEEGKTTNKRLPTSVTHLLPMPIGAAWDGAPSQCAEVPSWSAEHGRVLMRLIGHGAKMTACLRLPGVLVPATGAIDLLKVALKGLTGTEWWVTSDYGLPVDSEMNASKAPLATSLFLPSLKEASCWLAMRFQTVFGEQLRTHAVSGTVRTGRLDAGSTATTGVLIRLPPSVDQRSASWPGGTGSS